MVYFLLFFVSFILIWKSSELFVFSSHQLALKLALPPVVIGATVVAFGTSAPELFVNVFAAIDQQSEIVYGNLFGSNMANTCLILGVALLFGAIRICEHARKQLVLNVGGMVSISFLLLLVVPSRLIGLVVLAVFMYVNITHIESSSKESSSIFARQSLLRVSIVFVGSLLGLILSSKLLIYSIINVADFCRISTVFLSLFAVALGTSLPELISTIVFIKKGHADMVIGNVLGSNIFNIMFVLPVSWLVTPLPMPRYLVSELSILVALSFGVWVYGMNSRSYARVFGVWLFIVYALYIAYIYLRSHSLI